MERLLTDKAFLEKRIKDLGGIVKTADLETAGFGYRRIQSLLDSGFLKKLKNGYYTLGNDSMSADERIRVLFPDGILTMTSALYAYGYIDEKPDSYYIAIDKNVSRSRFKLTEPKVVPFYVERSALDFGVTVIRFGEGEMKIYTKERLLCEMLKYESKLNKDIVDKFVDKFVDNYQYKKQRDMLPLMESAVRRQVKHKIQTRLGDRI